MLGKKTSPEGSQWMNTAIRFVAYSAEIRALAAIDVPSGEASTRRSERGAVNTATLTYLRAALLQGGEARSRITPNLPGDHPLGELHSL